MSMATANDVERARREGELFGIPLGDLGWFQSLLMGVATGMAAFFGTTFVAIMALRVYMMATGKHPVGVVVMALALGFLGVQWSRRMVRKSRKA
jgi:ABC-type dipeptide/oligopeptide/nickel transport system permease subunit